MDQTSPGVFHEFPSPLFVERAVSVDDGDRIRDGDKYEIGTQHNTSPEVGGESFNPQWGPGQESLGDCAYAIYRFPLDDYSGDPLISVSWYSTPPLAEDIWVGLADFDQDTWEWNPYPAGHVLPYDPQGPYFNGDGDLLVALVVQGSESAVLDYIRVGPDIAPTCGIDPDPSSGIPPLTVDFTAWGFDIDGTVEKYEFDVLGEGSWVDSGMVQTTSHEYTASGVYYPKVRVTDNGGNQTVAETRVSLGWEHTWGGSGFESGMGSARLSDGSVVVLGLTTSFGQGANEVLLLKYSDAGSLIWQKTFGIADGEDPVAIAVDLLDNIYLACSAYDSGSSTFSPVIAKLDASGNMLAQKVYGLAGSTEARSLVIGPANSLFLLCTQSNFGGGDNGADILLLRFSSADLSLGAALSWNAGYDDSASGMAVDAGGNVYILGESNSFSSGNSSDNAILIRLNNILVESWAKVYGLDEASETTSLTLSNGKLFMCAFNRIVRTDMLGVIEQQREISGTSGSYGAFYAQGRSDGGCVLAGTWQAGFLEASLLKLDPDFQVVTSGTYGQPDVHEEFFSALPDTEGGLYIAGRSKDLDGNWGQLVLAAADPGLAMTDVSGQGSISTPAGTLSDWTGTLSDVPAGAETQDTGGGNDDLVIIRLFP